jgi:rhodanese-related sulfurtransferase
MASDPNGSGAATEISAAEAIERVAGSVDASASAAPASGPWLLDVREQWEWDRGHAPQAHLIPMSVIESRVGEIPEHAEVLVVSHSGFRSMTVATALVAAGYDAVSVAGGMDAWQSAGGVVVAP